MKYAKNILDTIGDTPLVKLNRLTSDLPCVVLAKYETFNPGNSVKDRMAVQMIEDAEEKGLLKLGGTIVEATSGNTGMGLALAATVKGYKLICVISDKQSKEKIDILKAMGSEVHVCPTNVSPDDPRSYYSTAKRLAKEIPGAWYANQYDNLSNTKAHFSSTGPEIWEQTNGKITHFVVGVGTGGTISGVGGYLKSKNPKIKIWGVDTFGSVFKKYHETGVFDKNEIYPYITEGIGEDILPENVNFEIIDGFTKVTDKDAAIYTRRLAREEAMFLGNSAGAAIKGVLQLKEHFTKDDLVVVLFHDHGSRYVAKMFNDKWMKEKGFTDESLITKKSMVTFHVGNQKVGIDAGELVNYSVNGHEYMHQKGNPGWGSADTEMFPIIGPTAEANFRINTPKGSAIQDQHGLLRELPYVLRDSSETHAVFQKKYKADTKVENSKYPKKSTEKELFWPYNFQFEKRFELKDDGLEITFEISGDEGMPFMLGYHPAFLLQTENPVITARDTVITLNEILAVGSRALHVPDCAKIALNDKKGLSIETEGFGQFMLWTEVTNMVCIEPISFYPYAVQQDQLNEGFDHLQTTPKEFKVYLRPNDKVE